VALTFADLGGQRDKGEALAKDVGGVFSATDVTDTQQVIAAVEAAKTLGPFRALVTAAGIGSAARTIGRDGASESAHDLDAFRKVVEINLVGTFNCVRLAASAMSQTEPLPGNGERGAIVTVASAAAFDGQIGQASYSASKGGLGTMSTQILHDHGEGAAGGQIRRQPGPHRRGVPVQPRSLSTVATWLAASHAYSSMSAQP